MTACNRRGAVPYRAARLVVLGAALAAFLPSPQASAQTWLLSPGEISARLRLFAPATLRVDTSGLPRPDREALDRLVRAGAIVERAYLRQNVAGGDTLPAFLARDSSEEGRLRLRYFLLNMSPWSTYDMNRAIVPGVPVRKPQQANLYPLKMLRSNWGGWFIGLDSARQAEAAGPWHVVRFDSAARLVAVPYSAEYGDLLPAAGSLLREAGALASDRGLREFCDATADAFVSNDYSACEKAMMKAGGPLSLTIGPTSLFLDNLFRYKRAYEVVVGVRNEASTKRLREMEKALPKIAKELGGRPSRTGTPGARRSSVRVDDAAFIGGAARSGSIASTLQLPVDTALVPATGTRTIILRNVHEAKFAATALPIAKAMLDTPSSSLVRFDAYLDHLMMRELWARFAPATPRDTTAGAERADPFPALAAADADAVALIALERMRGRGTSRTVTTDPLYATQVASLLRALRFWGDDPASLASAIQFNFHREEGAVKYDPAGGVLRVNLPALRKSVQALHSSIDAIFRRSDPREASAFFSRYAAQPPELLGLREQLSTIPVDIEPTFPLAH